MRDTRSGGMHHVRLGNGKPLVLIHGLGGSWRSWTPVLGALAAQREVIGLDLPGFGTTPPLPGDVTIAALADAVTAFLQANDLVGADVVGSSMGARLVLELARRGGVVGAVVALDPGGFWEGWERGFFGASIGASFQLVRLLQPVMPAIVGNPAGRTALLTQFSQHPWDLSAPVVLDELRNYPASPSFEPLLHQLATGPAQQGAPAGSIRAPLVIGWGRQDRVCFPQQAQRALDRFPDALVHWFENCGHFPMWDQPGEMVRLVLETTAGAR